MKRDAFFFLRPLDFLPREGTAAVLEAYFDESERTGGTFCVAGYAFAKPQAKKFAKEWSRLFPRGLHMVDFVHGRGEFSGTTTKEREGLAIEAVKTINTRISAGVAISCKSAEIEALSHTSVPRFANAYTVCCHLAMCALGAHLDENGDPEHVFYTFEAGHRYEGEAREFIKRAVACPEAKREYRHWGDAFLPKAGAVPLQSADMLAWEWAKCQDETIELPIRRIRRSLRELFRHFPKYYAVHHVTGPGLSKVLEDIHRLGLLKN